MKCLILASGFGTRLYPLTINKAKGLLKYKGKELISHIVDKIPQDIDIFVCTNMKFESDFRRWQDNLGREITLCVEPVHNESQSLGAIGSLDYCIRTERIADDLMVIASDNYFNFDTVQFLSAYNGKNALVAVHDIGDKNKATQYGVVQLDGYKIVRLDEKPAQPESSLVATAAYVFPQRIFPLFSRFSSEGKGDNLGNFIDYLTDKDEVHAYIFTELWIDVGSIDVYNRLQQNSGDAETI